MNFTLPIDHILKVVCSFPCHISYTPTKKNVATFPSRHCDTEIRWKWQTILCIQTIIVITWASRWLSATLWRSSRDWLTLFSSWRATCMASRPVPHSSRSGFYKQPAHFITFKVLLKRHQRNFLHFQPTCIKKFIIFSIPKIINIFWSKMI